jgi:hypothetical protein
MCLVWNLYTLYKLRVIECAEENWNRAKGKKFAICENVIDWRHWKTLY